MVPVRIGGRRGTRLGRPEGRRTCRRPSGPPVGRDPSLYACAAELSERNVRFGSVSLSRGKESTIHRDKASDRKLPRPELSELLHRFLGAGLIPPRRGSLHYFSRLGRDDPRLREHLVPRLGRDANGCSRGSRRKRPVSFGRRARGPSRSEGKPRVEDEGRAAEVDDRRVVDRDSRATWASSRSREKVPRGPRTAPVDDALITPGLVEQRLTRPSSCGRTFHCWGSQEAR